MAVTSHRRAGSAETSTRGAGGSVRLWLAALGALAVLVPVLSSVLGLYDRVLHWGKLVHGLDGFLVALLVGLLLLGWRDLEQVDLSDQLAALLTIFSGIFFGVLWEIVEFTLDWVRYADLQKSNSDTMTDLLWNDVGAVVATLVGLRLFTHALSGSQRAEVGRVARWLVRGPSRTLDRHGFLISMVVALIVAATVAAVWFAGRPLPGVGNG